MLGALQNLHHLRKKRSDRSAKGAGEQNAVAHSVGTPVVNAVRRESRSGVVAAAERGTDDALRRRRRAWDLPSSSLVFLLGL